MKRYAKKPKILKDKIKLAYLIRDNWERIEYSTHPTGRYYWNGLFKNNTGLEIRIHFQNYVRKMGINYVRMYFAKDFCTALTVGDIKVLLKRFENES